MARPLPLQQPCSPTQRLCWPAAGWRITGAYKGVVDISGTNGEGCSFGGYQVAYVTPFLGTPPSVMRGPYREPAPALALYYDTLLQGALSRRMASSA